jgi:peroxiredoxin (alkyl hydroperoxide reductase subunit C)
MPTTTYHEFGSIPKIGDLAPDFTAMTTHGEIQFSKWAEGSWVLLFSHPADFTPVCSTELAELARRHREFEQRKVRLLGLSIDSVHAHLAWRENLARVLGQTIPFPLVADSNMAVASRYGMIHPGAGTTVTVRAVFVIDPNRVVRALVYYPLNVGRNVDELIRIFDALQTADARAVACPVDWKPGDMVIVPPPRTEAEVAERMSLRDVERLDFYLVKKSLTGREPAAPPAAGSDRKRPGKAAARRRPAPTA